MSTPVTKSYPRAQVVKVTEATAGKLWRHARWWVTYEIRPGVFLSWGDHAPIVTHHARAADARADAVRTVAELRAKYGTTRYHYIVIQPRLRPEPEGAAS